MRFWVCSLLLFTFMIPVTLPAQSKKAPLIEYDFTKRPGKVVLTDETEIEGEIVFNDNDGIITVIVGDNSRSFNARSIQQFEFYESGEMPRRLFYSLEMKNPESWRPESEIFEVLREFETFLFLAHFGRLQTVAVASSPYSTSQQVSAIKAQVLYFIGEEGKLEPYLHVLESEQVGEVIFDWRRTKNRLLDAAVFHKYTGEHFSELQEYAKARKLNFKRKKDVLEILDEYKRLLNR